MHTLVTLFARFTRHAVYFLTVFSDFQNFNLNFFWMHAWLGANGSVKRDDIKHVAGKGRFPSCRLVLMAIGFFTYVNFHTLRIDLSVAIVAMVNSTHLRRVDTAAVLNISSQQSSLSDQHEQCGNDRDSNESRVTIDDDNVRLRIIV